MAEDNRDLLGDQIGWAVRQIIPPTPELRKLDRLIIRALPKPIARAVALVKVNNDWLPEVGNPSEMFQEMTKVFGQLYLDKFGEKNKANGVIMPSAGQPALIHSNTYHDGDRQVNLDWEKQVNWASTFMKRVNDGETAHSDDIAESTIILFLNNELSNFFDIIKPQFTKRGLPYPQLIDSRRVTINDTAL